MTLTTLSKPVRRVVPTRTIGALVVTLDAVGVVFRLKGRRTSYQLPYALAFQRAAQLRADSLRQLRKLTGRKTRRHT